MRYLALAALGFLVFGCAPRTSVPPTREAALRACEEPTAEALRARAGPIETIALAPLAATRIERRPMRAGSQRLGALVAGRAIVRREGAAGELRYWCLIGEDGRAVFVDVEPADAAGVLAECDASGRDRGVCLADLLRGAEAALAEAEAAAIRWARARGAGKARADIDEPALTSIGAWRIYRDAECARRRDLVPTGGEDGVRACRVDLTRERIRQLGG
jgi:hypothetical protein